MKRMSEQSMGEVSELPWFEEQRRRFRTYMIGEKMSDNTILRYLDIMEKFLLWFAKPPEKLTKSDMQRYKQEISPRYSANSMSTIVAGLNQYAEKILERLDLKLDPPKRVFKSKIPLTESEVQSILEETKRDSNGCGLRDHAMVSLMYWGGFRASEVAEARISDLDIGHRKMRVHDGKGNDNSIINLSETAIQAIVEYIKKGRPEPISPRLKDNLFLSKNGYEVRRGDVWEIVKMAAHNAGIEKNVHPHIFRHSMITHMAEKGVSASLIQAQSRHKSLDMVQHYTHLSEKAVREAYDRAFEQSPSSDTQDCEESAGMRSDASEMGKRKLRLYDLFIEGKITEEKLDKLLSTLETPMLQIDPRIQLV